MDKLQSALANSAAGNVTDLGDFTQYVNDDPMDELIERYAKILRDAKVGDFTYEGILAEFAHAVLKIERDKQGTNEKPGTELL